MVSLTGPALIPADTDAFARGYGQGAEMRDDWRQNALTKFMAQNGQAILGGDRNALAGLAGMPGGLGPAMDIQTGQQELSAQNATRMAQMLLTAENPQEFERAKAFAVRAGIVPEQEAMQYTFDDLPALQGLLAKDLGGTEFERLLMTLAPEDRAKAVRVRTGLAARAGQPVSVQTDQGTVFVDPTNPTKMSGPVPGTVSQAAPKLTEGERKAAGFLGRMQAAEATLKPFYDAGYTTPSFIERNVPFIDAETYLYEDDDRQVLQAQRDWVRAKLRLESGAVIGDEEMAEEVRTYFPQPGDGPEAIEQKRRSRLEAERQMMTNAGNAVPREDGGGSQSQDPGSRPAPAQIGEGTIIRNPQTGERRVMRGGQWVPIE